MFAGSAFATAPFAALSGNTVLVSVFENATASELTAAVRQEPAGAKVKIEANRNDIKMTFDVVLQEANE